MQVKRTAGYDIGLNKRTIVISNFYIMGFKMSYINKLSNKPYSQDSSVDMWISKTKRK